MDNIPLFDFNTLNWRYFVVLYLPDDTFCYQKIVVINLCKCLWKEWCFKKVHDPIGLLFGLSQYRWQLLMPAVKNAYFMPNFHSFNIYSFARLSQKNTRYCPFVILLSEWVKRKQLYALNFFFIVFREFSPQGFLNSWWESLLLILNILLINMLIYNLTLREWI